MTVTATEARTSGTRRGDARAPHEERLVPFPEAAGRLGRSTDTLRLWHDAGHFPTVVTPGDQWSAYESVIDAVLASARPGQAGQIKQIARDWFAARAKKVVTL